MNQIFADYNVAAAYSLAAYRLALIRYQEDKKYS